MSETGSEILAAGLEPEPFVRRALAALESDFREVALRALADWDGAGVPSSELFSAVAGLQRPSWGSWNGLLAALRNARKAVLRAGSARERERVARCELLDRLLALLDEAAPPELVLSLGPLGELTRTKLSGRVRLGVLLAAPIGLRNRIAHDSPTDAAWWETARGALRPLVAFHADRAPLAPFLAGGAAGEAPSPWSLRADGEVWAFNGLAHDFSVIYVSRTGASRFEPARTQDALLALQRLLGKAEADERDLRKLLAKLAPEELRGVVLGDFLVGRPVGAGGYATVHVGRQLSTGRKVAVKLLHDGLPEDAKARFQQEASFLSRFNHPSIVGVLGHGEEAWSAPRAFSLSEEAWYPAFSKGAPVKAFIALEWVEGGTLEDVFKRGAVGPHALAEWFTQAAGALALVHAAGLVHRDVKPGNLMVSTDGTVKLMDFGIARSQGESRTIVTTAGRAIGTPAYMSPEQLRAGDADAAVGPSSDIYSLCATFYELLSGTRLFAHDTQDAKTVETKKLAGERPPRPRRIMKGIPWELDTILMGGLEPDPQDRYPSMAELERDVRRFLKDEPIEYRRPSLLRRARLGYRRNRTVANIVAAFLVVAVLGSVQYVRAVTEGRTTAEKNLAEATRNLARVVAEKADRAWADGDRLGAEALLAHAIVLADAPDLRAKLVEWRATSPELLFATPCWPVTDFVALDATGRVLVTADFTHSPSLRSFSLESGAETTTIPLGILERDTLAVSADGTRALVGGQPDVKLLDLASGRELARFRLPPGAGYPCALDAHGERLILRDAVADAKGKVLAMAPIASSAVTALRCDPASRFFARAEADGSVGVFSLDTGVERARVRLAPARRHALAVSPRVLAVAREDGSVHVVLVGDDLSAHVERTIAVPDGPITALAIDGAGERIAACASGQVHLLDARTGAERASIAACASSVVALSPDGRTLVVAGPTVDREWPDRLARSRGPFVYALEESGSALVVREILAPSGHEDGVACLAFSPDGTRLLSGSWDGTLRAWDAATGREEQVLRGHEGSVLCAAVASDSRTVVSGSADGTLRVWDLTTGRAERTIRGREGSVQAVALYDASDDLYAFSGGPEGLWIASVTTGDSVAFLRTLGACSGIGLSIVQKHDGGGLALSEDPDRLRVIYAKARGIDLVQLPHGSVPLDVVSLRDWTHDPEGAVVGPSGAVDGQGLYVAVARQSGRINVWDLDREDARTLIGPKGLEGAAWFGDQLLTGGADWARLWDVYQQTPSQFLRGTWRVPVVAAGGGRIATGGRDGSIRVYGFRPFERVISDASAEVVPRMLSLDRKGERAVSCDTNGKQAQLWDVAKGAWIRSLGGEGVVEDAIVSRSGRTVLVADETGTVVVTTEGAPGRALRSAHAPPAPWKMPEGMTDIYHLERRVLLVLTPDDRQLLIGRGDGAVVRFDMETGRELPALEHGADELVVGLAASPDGRRVAVGTRGGHVVIWDLASGKRERTIDHAPLGSADPDRGLVAWSPGGTRLIAAGVLFDAATGERLRDVEGAYRGSFLSDERLVGHGSPLRLVPLGADAAPVKIPLSASTEAFAASDDGRRLVVGRPPGIAVIDLDAIELVLTAPPAALEALVVARTGTRVRDLDSPPLVVPKNRLARR